MEKKKFKKLSFIGIAIITFLLMDMVIIPAFTNKIEWTQTFFDAKEKTISSAGGNSATLNDTTEDGYIEWDDYMYWRYNTDYNINFGGFGNFGEWEWDDRGYVEWNISSLAGATLTANPVFKYEGYEYYATDGEINPITEGQPSDTEDFWLYNYIATGTPYVDPFDIEVGENKEVNLGASAKTDLQNAMNASQSWFAIGFQSPDDEGELYEELISIILAEEVEPIPPPTLYVEYTGGRSLEQEGFRFRNDDGNEAGATWIADQDTNIERDKNINTRLRVLLNANLSFSSTQYQLEVKKSTDGTYLKVPTSLLGEQVLTYTSSNTWVAPLGVSSVQVEAWGGGGSGGRTWDIPSGGGGGAGGAYAKKTISVTPGQSYAIVVGEKTWMWEDGHPSYFATGSEVYAQGGEKGGEDNGAGGVGSSASSKGDVVYAGGDGYAGTTTQGSPGGGGAGSGGEGGDATLTTAGSGTAVGGGNGGARRTTEGGGYDASVAGGGGGGSLSLTLPNFYGGDGARGMVKLTFTPQPPILLSDSTNIAASGEDTTAQLTPPAGKTTGDFVAGRIQDDENPADAVSITTDDYTEMEWCLKITDFATPTDVYQFRITASGTPLDTYSVTPQLTYTAEAANNPPTFSNEVPTNGSINIVKTTTTINVTIEDPDGDTFNWTIETSPNIGSNAANDQSNGSKSSSVSGLSSGTTYTWYVNCTDGTDWTREWYTFTTSYAPVLSNPGPANESIDQSLTSICNVTASDQDGGTLTVTFYENTTGDWVLQQTNSSHTANTSAQWDNYTNASSYSTKYWWAVNVTDGTDYVNETYHFTTEVPANTAPTLSGEVPSNTSTGISVTPDLYVLCLDDDADNMNATWWSNSSGAWLQFASNWTSFANNSNITQSFTNATSYSQTYYWSLNLTDGTDWCNETYNFTTAAGDWVGISSENYDSHCGEDDSDCSLVNALDGTNEWLHFVSETHWFILDLGLSYDIKKVRGRSDDGLDPITVSIYVSDDKGSWGDAVFSGNPGWSESTTWVETDTTDKTGQFIKIVITETQDGVGGELAFGSYTPFAIFDVYGDAEGNVKYYFDYCEDSYWGDEDNMVDGSIFTFASTTYDEYQINDGTTCPGDNLGDITKVETRFHGYASEALGEDTFIMLTPGDSDVLTTTPSWSSYFDITSEFSPWIWSDVQDLYVDVTAGVDDVTYYCSKVEIKVTYSLLNNPPTQSGEVPTNTSTGISLTPVCNVTANDEDGGDTLTVRFYENTTNGWVLQQTNSSVSPGTSVVWDNYNNASTGNTKYWWAVNVSDGTDYVNETYRFTTRAQYVPDAPASFTATANGRFQIDLSWTDDGEADSTRVEWHTAADGGWDPGDHNFLYNDSGESTSDAGLDPGTHHYYKAWSWNNTDNCWSSGSTDDATTNSNNAPSFETPSPNNGTGNQELSLTWSILIQDADSDTFNWTIECSNGDSNNSNDDSNGTKELSISGLSYNTQYTVWVNATDSYDWTREWYTFTTRAQSIPGAPGSFTATKYNRTKTDLSWNIGGNSDKTYIEWNTEETWNRGDGNFLYNDTGASYQHTDLDFNTQYFYQAWGWNETDKVYSSTYASDDATTDANQIPTQSSENPSDDSGNIEPSQATVSITINDPDGDAFNWTIQGQYITNTGANGASNGSKSANTITPLPYNTNIIWYVNVTDGYDWTNATYNFTTRAQYVPDAPSSFTATKYNRTAINLTWTNAGSNKTYIEWNSTEDWARGQGTTLDNSTNTTYNHTGLSFGTTYYYQAWSWNETDSCWSTTNSSDNATTDSDTAPNQNGVVPANASIDISITPDLYVLCTDADNDNMNATWWSNSSGAWLQFASNETGFANNTNITQSFTNATAYSTTYYWSVNLTDGTHWTNETYHITTEINNPPNAPTSPECDNQTNPGHVLDHAPYFDWVFSDPDGSDTQGGFHIQVGNDTDWGEVERWDNNQSSDTNSNTVYSGSTLYDGDTYYWRVKTKDNKSVWGSWTSNQNFRMNSVPSTLNLNSPANNSLHMSYTTESINFSWNAGTDAESDSLNYRWEYAKNSIFTDTLVAGWSGGPLYKLIPTAGNLDKSTDYYWRIKAWDGLEYGSYSVWRKFTTDDDMAPTQSGEVPTNGSTGVSTTPALYVICNDADGGDILTATWRSNSSGGWVDFEINTSISPGTNITQSFTNATAYSTTYYWSVNVTDGAYWTNETYHFTTRANKPSNITGENPANGSTGISLTPVCNVTVSDDDGHTSTVYFYENTTDAWVLQQTNTSILNESVIWDNYNNASACNTSYWWKVCVFDSYNWTNETYSFTSSEYVPDLPSSFSASASSSSQIDLSWTKGNKADTTYIEWNTASSWSRGDGTELYNNTGTSTSQSGLSAETTRYYQAWSWNNTGGFWSMSYDSTSATTESGGGGPSPSPGDTTPPTTPANVRCTTPETDNTPSFSWNASTDTSGISGYYVKIDDGTDTWVGNVLIWTSTTAVEDGSHTFYVKAKDASSNGNIGSYGSCSFTVNTTAVGNLPVADPNGPYTGLTLQNIYFDGSDSYDTDGTITNYTWDFGDGTIGHNVSPTHIYNLSGVYNVTLTVKNNDNLTDSNTTTATITLDSDGDGWSDDEEQQYGTDPDNSTSSPQDTDGDHIPDSVDTDDDNDGLDDIIEETLGSDPKDETDVTSVDIEGITYYLVDIDEDGQSNIFYNTITKNSTILGIRNDGTYLIDVDEDSEWDYIYDPASKTVTPYKEKPSEEFPWLLAIIGIIIATIVIIVILFLTGYIRIEEEYTEE